MRVMDLASAQGVSLMTRPEARGYLPPAAAPVVSVPSMIRIPRESGAAAGELRGGGWELRGGGCAWRARPVRHVH